MKKRELKEFLSKNGLNEGFIDNLINTIAQRKVDKKSKELQKKLTKTRDTLRDDFIEFYGSYENIPDSVKRVIEK